jgi:uncharacterized membrane protein
MKSMYAKIALFILIVGVLSACGSQPANPSTSQPTEEVLPATEVPTDSPTAADTTAPTESAAATQPAVEGATVSFTNDILPIFESRCINCHGGDKTQEGLDLKTHAALMAGSDNDSVITPGDSVNSLLVELVVSQKMPKRGPKLTPPQVQLITDWVNQGALDN